jgi:hypothetical protein
VVKKPFRPVDIEITEVTRFSYGQTEDGDIVIWALGAAGWFELRPSRTYKAIFQDMVQAVEILYFVTDIYNQPRKRGGGPSAQLIFQEVSCVGPANGIWVCCANSPSSMRRMNGSRAMMRPRRSVSSQSIALS